MYLVRQCASVGKGLASAGVGCGLEPFIGIIIEVVEHNVDSLRISSGYRNIEAIEVAVIVVFLYQSHSLAVALPSWIVAASPYVAVDFVRPCRRLVEEHCVLAADGRGDVYKLVVAGILIAATPGVLTCRSIDERFVTC